MFPVGSLFPVRVSHHLGRATFPAPASSKAARGFPVVRSPVCFASGLMGPILPERLSPLVEPLGSHRNSFRVWYDESAHIPLKADVSEAGEGWSDSAISAALDTSINNIGRTGVDWSEKGSRRR